MVVNFTQKLNHCRLVRVNQNRVKLKGLDTGNQNAKSDSRKLTHMWGIKVDHSKKTIIETTQNAVRCVIIPLTKRFWKRREIFRCQRLRKTAYTDTMIAGVKSASGNRVTQVYVTYFGDVRIYTMEHRIEARTS